MVKTLRKVKRAAVLIVFFGLAGIARAQDTPAIPPFSYVCVETLDHSGVKDMFQVSLYTRKWMLQNGYQVVADNKASWQEEVRMDSCNVLTVKLLTHDRYKGKYRTSVFMVDCRQDTVFRAEGKSMGGTDAEGFQNAAFVALKEFRKELTAQSERAQKQKKSND